MVDVSQQQRALNFNDIRGKRFGRLSVLSDEPERIPKHMLFVAACDCGSPPRRYRSCQLVTGRTRSCGCLKRETTEARLADLRHGQTRTGAYFSWSAMIQRTTNAKNPNYPEYGGSGITVCSRWRESFLSFLEDMGPRPLGNLSIDRYPNKNGNYEPGNCRWATDVEQANNRRTRRWLKRPTERQPKDP